MCYCFYRILSFLKTQIKENPTPLEKSHIVFASAETQNYEIGATFSNNSISILFPFNFFFLEGMDTRGN